MTTERIFYKLLLRENNRLRSFNDERIVWYDENIDVRDDYPLFVFDRLSDVLLFAHWQSYLKYEVWHVITTNSRPLEFGKMASESHAAFWSEVDALQHPRYYEKAGTQFGTELPRGTYVCDSLRLIERVF
jgi:hypothetical protein